jgi:hypothetical protein
MKILTLEERTFCELADMPLCVCLTHWTSHSRLAVDNHTWKEILFSYQASPFSIKHTGPSGTESAPCNKFLCRTPSPPPLDPLPQTPPLFPRINVTPEQPAYVPVSMSDLSFVAPLINGDRNEGTPEYATISDEWGT